jgi:hypothetical protein
LCYFNRDGVTVTEELSKMPIRAKKETGGYKGDLDLSSRIITAKFTWLEIIFGSATMGWFIDVPSWAFAKIRVLRETGKLSGKEKRGKDKRR